MLFPAVEVTRLLSNLIKYQFVNLKSQDTFLVDPEKKGDKFIPLKKDSRVKIRTLEEVEREEKEKAERKKEAELRASEERAQEEESSTDVSAADYDGMLEQKTEEAEAAAEKILQDARQQAETAVHTAEEEADQIRQAAREEGFESGRQEGLAQVEEETARIRAELEAEEQQMQQDYQALVEQLEPQYVNILCSLIQKLTGVLMEENKDLLLHLIRSSIVDMEAASRYTIRVSPEDALTLEKYRDGISKEVGKAAIEIQEDKGLAKDECMIETDRQMVDCGFKTQLDNLLMTLRMLVQEG